MPSQAVAVSTTALGRTGEPELTTLHRFPAVLFALTLLFLAFMVTPTVRSHPVMLYSFAGIGAGFLAWEVGLWRVYSRARRAFRVEFGAVRAHYVQACVQFTIITYWGWYVPQVYEHMPHIFAQVVYLYIFDGLLTFTRGKTWRFGFGPLPIIFSTNLLLWFRDDWFFLQFLMITIGALGKQFITWERDGVRTHIFNPSVFGQTVVAIVLIATSSTAYFTWGKEMAVWFETPPLMFVVIFLMGVIVQSLFHVTIMTLAAVSMLSLLNLAYLGLTETYYFVNINMAATIFLGMHLLITDPATSPRTNIGRVLFGAAYGFGYFALFRVLDYANVPLFWDKLLPVGILNLLVPLIDRFCRSGWIGRLNTLWETALPRWKLNLVHMSLWSGLFCTMWFTGYLHPKNHPGDSVPFWKKALKEGKPMAGHSLIMAAGARADAGDGAASNELGLICMEGKLVDQFPGSAAKYFAQACRQDNKAGCENVAIQYLFVNQYRSEEDVDYALDRLEGECARSADPTACFIVGHAYETGRGRPVNKLRALELYELCGSDNLCAVKGRARILLQFKGAENALEPLADVLAWSCNSGDGESCWYLSYMYASGRGVFPDPARARTAMEQACRSGVQKACEAVERGQMPKYSNPPMLVPGWSQSYPEP